MDFFMGLFVFLKGFVWISWYVFEILMDLPLKMEVSREFAEMIIGFHGAFSGILTEYS